MRFLLLAADAERVPFQARFEEAVVLDAFLDLEIAVRGGHERDLRGLRGFDGDAAVDFEDAQLADGSRRPAACDRRDGGGFTAVAAGRVTFRPAARHCAGQRQHDDRE